MRAAKQEGTGSAGEHAAASKFELLNWGVALNPDHDLGTDLWLMARDSRRFDLGLLVGAQVKTGKSYFREPSYDESGVVEGWWFRESKQSHFQYWIEHTVPHIVILQTLEDGVSYWAHVLEDAVQFTDKGAKLFIPRSQVLDPEHFDDLLAVATSQRFTPAWEGTAWTGGTHVLPTDRLRYALVAPRLVAPHPNTLPGNLDATQAIAMLALVRLHELKQLESTQACPSVEEASSSPEWEWRFYADLHDYVYRGDPSILLSRVTDALMPYQRAAAVVVASASLLEDGHAEQAQDLLDSALSYDDAEPVDHAWLQVNKGRTVRELGHLQEARELGVNVQSLRASASYDATAMAIAAAAADLVFASSSWDEHSVSDVITYTDTAVSWWRSQQIAWGLNDDFDRHFKAWAKDTAITFGGGSTAWRHLRAASLMAGFAGDHTGWRHAVSLLNRLYATRRGGRVRVRIRRVVGVCQVTPVWRRSRRR